MILTKKTKIVCTIGPASQAKETLLKMIDAGMNIARLNFSHGTYDEHYQKILTIREIEKERGIIIPIMLDTKGPEIRTGNFVGGSASIKTGDIVRIYMTPIVGDNTKFSVTYTGLYDDCKIGAKIRLDDGNLGFEVVSKDEKEHCLVVKALNHHVIKDERGVNCPDTHLNMEYISKKDRADLVWGCQNQVDYISASFIRNVKDIQDIRAVLDENGGSKIKIISKVEALEAIDNLDDIIAASDGLMVARGDLGVEIPAEDVPVVQREMITKCRKLGKPVITATQMLDSMQHNPNPTRAEVSDVANAVMESTDAVMLSGESASGEYPVEAVAMQAKISAKMEQYLDYESLAREAYDTSNKTLNDALANAVAETAALLDAKLIVCFSETGSTARRLSKCRPICPIIDVSRDRSACVDAMMGFGAYPKLIKHVPQFIEDMEAISIHLARLYQIPDGSKVVITGGTPVGAGKTNFMKVITFGNKEVNIDL
ncbi:MAG: pyruvate kinase [Bacilli bacterium]|jgi:pyruvate kinase|nr:pyruvate kinase [Bacilli bacterium]